MWRRFIRRGSRTAPETTGPDEVLMVITAGETPVGHGLTRARRVNEAAAACIDSHVIDVETVDAKKNQVTRRECIHCHRPGRKLLFPSRSWNLESRAFVRVNRQTTAVKALQVGATEVIGRADQLQGRARDRRPAVTRRLLLLTGDTATGRQEQHQNNRGD